MTGADSDVQKCTYTHDISGDIFDDIPGETWSCPHGSADNADCCPVHRQSASTQEVRSFIKEACEREPVGPRETQFFGAKCNEIKLDHLALNGSSMFPIDLRDGDFGDVTINNSRIQRPISLAGATIRGSIDCKKTVFSQDLNIQNAVISGDATFDLAKIENWCDIGSTCFNSKATFNGTVFARGIIATGVEFNGHSKFVNTNFNEMANFRNATFVGRADFDGPEFFLDARFDGSDFKSPAFFETTKFHQVGVFRDVVFEGPVSFRNCLSTGRASFQNATFEDTALFPGVEFESVATFNGAEFYQGIDLCEASISEIKFEPSIIESEDAVIGFREASIKGGTLQVPDSGVSVIQLTNATLGDVELRSNGTKPALDSFILNDVRYEGFHFDRLEKELRNGGRRLETVGSSGYRDWWQSTLSILPSDRWQRQQTPEDGSDGFENSTLERTYRKAKNGADRVGEPKISSYFFRREMKYRRKRHWETVRDSGASRGRRLTAGFQWIANAALYITAGYGERPSWTIISSVVSILLFAGVYISLGVYTGNARVAESLLFSAQGFVTFIIGEGPNAVGIPLKVLSVIEGFIGAFLVAVFVFTLTRTVYR